MNLFIFAYQCPIALATFVEKVLLPPLLLHLCQNQLDIFMWVYLQVFYSLSLVYVLISLPIPHILGYTAV